MQRSDKNHVKAAFVVISTKWRSKLSRLVKRQATAFLRFFHFGEIIKTNWTLSLLITTLSQTDDRLHRQALAQYKRDR